MQTEIITKNNTDIVHVTADNVVICDLQSTLDLLMNVEYQTGIKNIAISKKLVTDKFFVLSSGLAGEILQKIVNYHFRIAIYGDYSVYTSKPLKDFIYESNNGCDVFFTDSLEQALDKLSAG